jgi:hypothetical protein
MTNNDCFTTVKVLKGKKGYNVLVTVGLISKLSRKIFKKEADAREYGVRLGLRFVRFRNFR